MLQLTQRGFFKRSYEFTDDGRPVTTIAVRREGGEFTVDGQRFEIRRESRKEFSLHGPAGRLATVARADRRMWTISSPKGHGELVLSSAWRKNWELRWNSEPAGTLAGVRAFKRTRSADLAEQLPLPLRLFVFHLVQVLADRDAAAAGSAAAAAGG